MAWPKWPGTPAEATAFVKALSSNCACEVSSEGVRVSTCAPHVMYVEDQRALRGLVWARRMRERLIAEVTRP